MAISSYQKVLRSLPYDSHLKYLDGRGLWLDAAALLLGCVGVGDAVEPCHDGAVDVEVVLEALPAARREHLGGRYAPR
jgi:hypothetical protein